MSQSPFHRFLQLELKFALVVFFFSVAIAETPPVSGPGHGIEVRYEGLLNLEGHFKKPGETRPYHSRQIFLVDGRGNARLDWTTWSDEDTAGAPESFLLAGNQVFHREDSQSPWRELVAEKRELARLQILAGVPGLFYGNETGKGLKLKRQKKRLKSVENPQAHPRLGDVINSIQYEYKERDTIPSGFQMILHERDHQWSLQARRTGFSRDVNAESLLAVPDRFEPAPPGAGELTGEPVLVPRAEGVWSLEMEDIDSRSLVVEFTDYLALIEAAVGSANGERMVEAVKRRWPEKPIRYFFFSHYHPHYTGGLRAFIAEGATVVTTPGNEEFTRQAARYPFRISPDRLARSPRPLRLRTFQKRFELVDSTNRLVAIDIGERSTHTDEFVIFYLPKQKLLFEAEQGWVTVEGKLRAARRAEGFLKILADEGVEVERLVQCWPMRDNKAEVSRSEFEALVRERKK